MKKTQKYLKACEILTYPHETQDELYLELSNLGWNWNCKTKEWERNNIVDKKSSDLIKVRLQANSRKVDELAQHLIELVEDIGLKPVKISNRNILPNQIEAVISIEFLDVDIVDVD